jgi:hypothetical protein
MKNASYMCCGKVVDTYFFSLLTFTLNVQGDLITKVFLQLSKKAGHFKKSDSSLSFDISKIADTGFLKSICIDKNISFVQKE